MRRRSIVNRMPKREIAVGTLLLALYAVTLFGAPDAEWAMWAGQMTMGVLYVTPAPAVTSVTRDDALKDATAMGTAGLFVAAAAGIAGSAWRDRIREGAAALKHPVVPEPHRQGRRP